MWHASTSYLLNFQFVLQNSMNNGLEVEVMCQLTNIEVRIIFNLCNNSVNIDLCYRGAFPSTVFWIQNGQLAAFFKLMVPPRSCPPSEQSISIHTFHFIECLCSCQATSNTILHNKPLLRLHCYGEAYCGHIPIVTPLGWCFVHSSITRRLFHRLRCASALLTWKRTSFSMVHYKYPISGASTS